MRTKLGISAGLLAAIMYWCGFFNGMIPLILIAGYVFLKEENDYLKRTALKAIVFMLGFALIKEFCLIIPVIIGDIMDLVRTYAKEIKFNMSMVTQPFYFIRDIIDWIQIIFFVSIGFLSLKFKDIPFGPLDKLVDNNIIH